VVFGGMAFLWFLTCFAVMGYGLSNGAVQTLGLPRWTSLAVVGLGFLMLMSMFAFFLYGDAAGLVWFEDGGNRDFEGD
jgi:hypothetical protein